MIYNCVIFEKYANSEFKLNDLKKCNILGKEMKGEDYLGNSRLPIVSQTLKLLRRNSRDPRESSLLREGKGDERESIFQFPSLHVDRTCRVNMWLLTGQELQNQSPAKSYNITRFRVFLILCVLSSLMCFQCNLIEEVIS